MTCSEKTGFSKWDCFLNFSLSEIPFPFARLVEPGSSMEKVHTVAEGFLGKASTEFVGLRADGGNGCGNTPAAISFRTSDLTMIEQKIFQWSCQKFAVVLLEVPNRFDCDYWCNCIIKDEEGAFGLEFVGPGFDAGDLSKSILRPTLTVDSRHTSILDYSDPISGEASVESLESLPFRVEITSRLSTKCEIEQRLSLIATKLLPDMGIMVGGTAKGARRWLEEHNLTQLLSTAKSERYVSFDELKKIILCFSRYGHTLKRQGQKLAAQAVNVFQYKGKMMFMGAYSEKKWLS